MAVDIIIDPLTGQIYWNDSQSTAQSIAISGNGSDLIKVVGYSLGYTAAPSGTITTGAATTAVTGSGTAFTTQIAQGAILYTAQGTSIGTVSTITNDTSLSLATNASGSYTAISFRITPSTGTDRLVFSDSATPIYPATTGANLGTSSYRWSLYASAGDFTNTSTTVPNLVVDKSGIGSTESAGLQFVNTTLATSGAQYQFPSWLEFKGKVWNTTVTAASNDARMRIGMAVNPGASPQTEFVLASSIDTGTASWYYPLTINSTTNDSVAYFNNSLVSIGKLLTLGTTSSYALELYNYSLATSGETVHYSPGFDQNASAWNTSTATSNIVRFRSEVQPTSGASVAGTLIWKSAVATSYSATPSFTDRFKIGSDGTVTIPGSLTLGSASGALYAASGAVSVGTLSIANGGTGSTTATSAINALLPSQTSNGGKYLTTDGTTASWGTVAASPGGSNGQIQFNNSSSFGGADAMVYSSATTTAHLTITSQAVGNTPLLLKGIASQSANSFDVQNSSGTSLINIASTGSGVGAKLQIIGTSSNQNDLFYVTNGGNMTITGGYAGQRGLRTGFRTNGNNTADRYFWNIGRGYDGFGYFGFGCDESTGVGFNVNSATEGFPLSAKRIEDATTNTVTDVLNIERSTSGTAAAGIGARISYRQEHAGGTVVNTIGLDGILSDAGSTTYVGALSVKTNNSGTTTLTERARFDNNAFSLYPLGASAGNTYELRFMELAANGSNYIGFKGPDSVATNYTYVWPDGAPSAGQLLSASAPVSGVVTLSWATDQLGTSGGGITSLNGLSAASQSFANDTNVTISSVTSTHTLGWSGTLAVGRGGTGTSTAPTQYGVTYGLSTTALAYTAAGSTDQVLKSGGGSGAPSWGAISLGSTNAVSGTLGVTNGGTGQTTYTDGQLLIGNSTGNTLTKATLTAGTNISITNGNGSITINATSGGSGTVGSGTANQIAYYSGATTTASAASMVYSAATTTSHLTITAQAVGNNPLKLVGATSQTADLFTVATSGGTVFNISSTGVINSGTWNGTTIAVGYGGTGTSTAPTQWGVIFATSTSQYASTGAGSTDAPLLARTSGSPAFAALPLGSSNAVTGTLAVGNGGTGTSSFATSTILTSNAASTTGAVTTATALAYSASNQHLIITAQGAATSPLRLVGATSQTADLFQIYSTSAGTLLGSVGAFGGATFTSLATSATTPATALIVTGAAHTALNTATEYSDVYFNLGQTKTFATGGITTLRTFRVAPATYAFSGASTVTNAATFQIDGAPTAGTNATLTEAAALRILTGTASGKGLVIRGSSSQTGNYIDVQNNSGSSLVTLGTTNINLGPHGVSAGNTFELRFSELSASGSEYIAFKAPDAITTSYTYVWPSGAPSAGQLLSASAPSAGVVTLTWATDQLGTSGGGITSLNSATGASQSFSNDTNVTITTNTGTNTHALGWSGSLAISRGGIGTTSFTTSNALVYFDNANSKLATLGTGATTTVLVGGGASAPSFAQVNLTSMVTGTLPLANGGLGTTTFTQYGVLYGNAATSVLVTAAGTNGQLFLGVTSGAPQWGTMSGDASIGNTGVVTIANTAVTFAKIQNSASAGLSVIGRSTNSAGSFAEIAATTNGSVLRLSGTTLGFGAINLATTNAVTGTLPLGNGGLGTTTFTQYGILYGNAATSVLVTAAGSADQVLKSGAGSAAPSWGAISLGSSNAVSGILGLTNGGTATSSFATTNGLIYYTGSALATLAATVSGVLVTNGTGVPSVSTDIPTGVTIGASYIYRAGGTDVALADGGTGQSTYSNGDILYYNSTSSTTALTKLGIAATSGYFLTSTGSLPQWSQTLGLANGGTGLTSGGTGNYILGMNSGGSALEYKQLIQGSNVTITHGAGTITIAATGGTSSAIPGGSDTYVQYNSGGTTFGGTSYFAYDYTSALLTLTASTSIQTTSTAALELENNTAPSTSIANHYSPAVDFAGRYWSAGASYYAKFREELQTTAATPTYAMVWKSSSTTSTTPSFTNRMALDATKGLGLYAYSGAGAGTNASFFKAGAQTSDFNYTLPTTAPSTSQILSVSAVSGSDITLAWANDATGGGGGGTVSSGTANQLAYYSGTTTTASAPALVYSATGTHLTITAQGASTSPLKVVGAASQSASIFTVSTSGGDVLTVDSNGYTSITGLSDAGVTFQNSTTTTKKFKFDAASITAGNTRTITIPDATTTMVGTDATQTLTNKTLSAAVVTTSASITAAGTTSGTATAITNDYNVVTSSAATTDPFNGVILPAATTGRMITVVNRSTNPIYIYPQSGSTIDGSAGAEVLSINRAHTFMAASTTSWYQVAGAHKSVFLTFCTGYTPATTGADSVILRLPDNSDSALSASYYIPRELNVRVETPSAGTSAIQVEYYTGTSAFSATNLLSSALSVTGVSTYEFSSTGFSTTSLSSGTKLRINFTSLNTTHANFFVQLLLEER